MHVSTIPAVELEDVSFAYRGGPPALEGVSLAVEQGAFVGIAGPNGGGKTTLLRAALGLERPASGRVLVFGRAAGRARRTAHRLSRSARAARVRHARHRARARRSRPPRRARAVRAAPRRADRAAVAHAIERVGLDDRADAPLRTLSGGMQQRAFIAKALATEPTLLALDEPTTGVDAESQESLAVLLAELRTELGVTILYVSHEFGAVEHVVSRLVLVRRGSSSTVRPSELPAMWHDPSHVH